MRSDAEADVFAIIAGLFERRGALSYLGEKVSMAEHMLQAAANAEREKAPPPLIAAALLHDLGHLIVDMPAVYQSAGVDRRHEAVGARLLERCFGPEVWEPVRLHVQAKRYLCAVEAGYRDALTPSSIETLAIQGGPMSPAEVVAFEREPLWREAVKVRRWDDAGKVAGVSAPGLEHHGPLLEALRRDGWDGR